MGQNFFGGLAGAGAQLSQQTQQYQLQRQQVEELRRQEQIQRGRIAKQQALQEIGYLRQQASSLSPEERRAAGSDMALQKLYAVLSAPDEQASDAFNVLVNPPAAPNIGDVGGPGRMQGLPGWAMKGGQLTQQPIPTPGLMGTIGQVEQLAASKVGDKQLWDLGLLARQDAAKELEELSQAALQLSPVEQERLGIGKRMAELQKIAYADPREAAKLKAQAFQPQQVTLAPAFTPIRSSLGAGAGPGIEAPASEVPAVQGQVPFAQQKLMIQSAAVKAVQDKAAAATQAEDQKEIDKELRTRSYADSATEWSGFRTAAADLAKTLREQRLSLVGLPAPANEREDVLRQAKLKEIDAAIQEATSLSQIGHAAYRKTPYQLPSTAGAEDALSLLKGILIDQAKREENAKIDQAQQFQVGLQESGQDFQREMFDKTQAADTERYKATTERATQNANYAATAGLVSQRIEEIDKVLQPMSADPNANPARREALVRQRELLTSWQGKYVGNSQKWTDDGSPSPVDPTQAVVGGFQALGTSAKTAQERKEGYEGYLNRTRQQLSRFEAEIANLPAVPKWAKDQGASDKEEQLKAGADLLRTALNRYEGKQSLWEADAPPVLDLIDPTATAQEIKTSIATVLDAQARTEKETTEAKLKKGQEFNRYRDDIDRELTRVGNLLVALGQQPGVSPEDIKALQAYEATLNRTKSQITEDGWDGKPLDTIATAGSVADALIKARDVTKSLEESTRQATEARQQARDRRGAAAAMVEALRGSPIGATNKDQVDALERRLLGDPSKGLTETEYAEILNEYAVLQKVDASVVGVMALPEAERYKKLQELGLVDEEGNLNDAGKKALGAVAGQKVFSTGYRAAQEAEARPNIERLAQVDPETLALTPSLQEELRSAQTGGFKDFTPKQAADLLKRVETAQITRNAQVRIKQYEEAGVNLSKQEVADLQSGEPAKVQAVEVAAFRRMLALPPSRNERQAAASVESVDRNFALASPWLTPETKAAVREVLGSTDTATNKWAKLSDMVNSPEWNNALNQRDLVLKAEADETLKQIKRGDVAFALQTTSALVQSLGDSFSDPTDPRISKTLNEWRKQGVPEHVLTTASALIREQLSAKKTGRAVDAAQLGVALAGQLTPGQFTDLLKGNAEIAGLLGGSAKVYKDMAAKRVKLEETARSLGMTADALKVFDVSGLGIYNANGSIATPEQFNAGLEKQLGQAAKELRGIYDDPADVERTITTLRKNAQAAYGNARYKFEQDTRAGRRADQQLNLAERGFKADEDHRAWQKNQNQIEFDYRKTQDGLQYQLALRTAQRLEKDADEGKRGQSLAALNQQVQIIRQQGNDVEEQYRALNSQKQAAIRQLAGLQGKFDADPAMIQMLQGEVASADMGMKQLEGIRNELGQRMVAADGSYKKYAQAWGLPYVDYKTPNAKPTLQEPPPYLLTPSMLEVLDNKAKFDPEFRRHLGSLVTMNNMIAANGGDASILEVALKEKQAGKDAVAYFKGKGYGDRAILAYAEIYHPGRIAEGTPGSPGSLYPMGGASQNIFQAGGVARQQQPPLVTAPIYKPPTPPSSLPLGQLNRQEANPKVVQTYKDFAQQYGVGFGGIVGDESHQNRTSDHNTWDAVDMNIANIEHGNTVAFALVRQAQQRGVKYVIWNGQVWEPGKGWSKYTGSDPHTKHVHASFTRDTPQLQQAGK